MSEVTPDILLLADDEVAAELAGLAGGKEFVHRRGSYEAIAEFARRPYQAVVMTHPRADFAGLVRGFRRLRSSAKRFALCSPAGEAQLRVGGPYELDDYFIYPPRPEELEHIIRGAALPAGAAAAPPADDLSADEVAEFVAAAGTIDSLADLIARRAGEWTARKVRWVGAGQAAAPGRAMLLLDADPPRALLADDSDPPPAHVRRKLQALQSLLGPLAANARRTDALHRLAITDHLTGAYNRRYFYHFTDQLLAKAEKEDFRVTLLLYDIDDFKRYNDTYGHAAGDDILCETASLMTQATREHDIVARIGGDEFAVLFWDAEPPRQADSQHPDSARVLARRFLGSLAKHEFSSLGPEAKGVLTISGGLATFPRDGRTCRELLRQADTALRAAKASGKSAIYLVGAGGDGKAKPVTQPAPPRKKAASAKPRTKRPKR